MIIKTSRLLIRPFTENDLNNDLSWFLDKDVMKYIPKGPDKNREGLINRIIKYIEHYHKYGFSKYLIIQKDNNELIGDAGLLRIENTNYIELGYRIKKSKWNNGFATEACLGIIEHAFNELHLNVINAITENENVKSKYILENKLGFKYLKSELIYGENMLLYELIKNKGI